MKITTSYNNPYQFQQKKQAFGLTIRKNPVSHFWGTLNGEVPLLEYIRGFNESKTAPLFDLLTYNKIEPANCNVDQGDLNAILWHSTDPKNDGNQPWIINMFMNDIMGKKGVKLP